MTTEYVRDEATIMTRSTLPRRRGYVATWLRGDVTTASSKQTNDETATSAAVVAAVLFECIR